MCIMELLLVVVLCSFLSGIGVCVSPVYVLRNIFRSAVRLKIKSQVFPALMEELGFDENTSGLLAEAYERRCGTHSPSIACFLGGTPLIGPHGALPVCVSPLWYAWCVM